MFSRNFLNTSNFLSRSFCHTQLPISETGISFRLCDGLKELREKARKFCREEVMPKAAYHDETGEFPWDIVKKAHAEGLMNPGITKEYGGSELGPLGGTLIDEEFGYGCTGIGNIFMSNDLAISTLKIAGNEKIKKNYLGRMTQEAILGAFAVFEPQSGSDLTRVETVCEKSGDEWVINGSKMWVSNGDHANWYFVLCRSDASPTAPPTKAFTAFIIDADASGITKGKRQMNLGQHASDIRGITFENVRVSDDNVVGPQGEGFVVAMRALDRIRPCIAALATGLQSRCIDEAIKYALEEKRFGIPVCEHQAMQMLLADMAINNELSRMLTYRSAWELMTGVTHGYYSTLAKCFAGDAANKAANSAVQILGANGYNREYGVEKLLRDAKVFQIYDSTNETQRNIIAKNLLDRIQQIGSISLIA